MDPFFVLDAVVRSHLLDRLRLLEVLLAVVVRANSHDLGHGTPITESPNAWRVPMHLLRFHEFGITIIVKLALLFLEQLLR